MTKYDNEDKATGLGERRGMARALGDGGRPSNVSVPCKQCGQSFRLSVISLERWEAFNVELRRRKQPELQKDEIGVCDRAECKAAEREDVDRYAAERDARRDRKKKAATGRKRRSSVDKEIA